MANVFFAQSAARSPIDYLQVVEDFREYEELADLHNYDETLAESVAARAVDEQRALINEYGSGALWLSLQPHLYVDLADFTEAEYLEFVEHFVLDCFESPDDCFEQHIDVAHGAVLVGRADTASGAPLSGDHIAAAVRSAVNAGVPDFPPFDAKSTLDDFDRFCDVLDLIDSNQPRFGDLDPTPALPDEIEPAVGDSFDSAVSVRDTGHPNIDKYPADLPVDVSDEERRVYEYGDYHGEVYSIVVDQPQTFVIGEEGEHVFGLKNRSTLIVPGDFIDYRTYWGTPA